MFKAGDKELLKLVTGWGLKPNYVCPNCGEWNCCGDCNWNSDWGWIFPCGAKGVLWRKELWLWFWDES